MQGLTVHNTDLLQVLRPCTAYLDQCWWWLSTAAVIFPGIREPSRLPPPPRQRPHRGSGRYKSEAPELGPYDPADWERYLAENDAESRALEEYVVAGFDGRICKPAFFSRYANGLVDDWKIYFASDAVELPAASFGEADSRFHRVWFDAPPPDLPQDICLIIRNIDNAYLDLFFRDEKVLRTVQTNLEAARMKFSSYQRYDPATFPGKDQRR